MQVEIPTGLQVLSRGRSEPGGQFDPQELEEVVDVHLATPYGISSHLLVPVANAGAAAPSVHFEMRPGAKVSLTYKVTTSGETRTVAFEDFFRFNQDRFVIRAPRLAEITANNTITFFLRDAKDHTYLGSFPVESVPLNSYDYEYYLTGTQLANVVASIKTKTTPYLAFRKITEPITIEVSARLPNDVPVAGRLTVECNPVK
jgi:hypothetical protein